MSEIPLLRVSLSHVHEPLPPVIYRFQKIPLKKRIVISTKQTTVLAKLAQEFQANPTSLQASAYVTIRIFSGIFPPLYVPWNGGENLVTNYLYQTEQFITFLRKEMTHLEAQHVVNERWRTLSEALRTLPDPGVITEKDLRIFYSFQHRLYPFLDVRDIDGSDMVVRYPMSMYTSKLEQTFYSFDRHSIDPIQLDGKQHLVIEDLEDCDAFSPSTCAAFYHICMAETTQQSMEMRAHCYLSIFNGMSLTIDPKFQHGLKPYQHFVAKYMMDNHGLLCFHDAGTGKTMTTIGAMAQYLYDDDKRQVVVVCPASVVGQWQSEIERSIIPIPTAFTAMSLRKTLHMVSRIHILSYQGFEKDMKMYMSSTSSTTIHPHTLYVFDEIHDVPSRLVMVQKGIVKPLGSYWIRAACLYRAEKVMFLSATPIINDLADLKHICQNILIVNMDIPTRQQQGSTLLEYDKLCGNVWNASITKQIMESPFLPNVYRYGNEIVRFTPSFTEVLKKMPEDEYVQSDVSVKLRILLSNLHGMIHRIVRNRQDVDFPQSHVLNHVMSVDAHTEYARQYKKSIHEGLVFANPRTVIPSEIVPGIITDVDTNFFTNQRLMSSRIYQRRKEGPLPARRLSTTSQKRIVGRIPLHSGDYKGHLIQGGIFSPKIFFLTGHIRDMQQYHFSILDPHKKIVIYAHFRDNYLMIHAFLTTQPLDGITTPSRPLVFVITGDTPVTKRRQIVDRFNASSGKIVLIISDAGATGIDLKGVTDIVFYDQVWTGALYAQIEGRGVRYRSHNHLPILDRTVVIHNLLLQDPLGHIHYIDEFMMQKIHEKQQLEHRVDNMLRLLCDPSFGDPGLLLGH